MNEITQTNFTMRIVVPSQAVDHGVLRLRYVSQNPTENDRGTTFYQCADVKVVAGDATSSPKTEEAKATKPEESSKDLGCCAPKQFALHGYETNNWRNPTQIQFYFDAVNQLFRIDTNSGDGKTNISIVCHIYLDLFVLLVFRRDCQGWLLPDVL